MPVKLTCFFLLAQQNNSCCKNVCEKVLGVTLREKTTKVHVIDQINECIHRRQSTISVSIKGVTYVYDSQWQHMFFTADIEHLSNWDHVMIRSTLWMSSYFF